MNSITLCYITKNAGDTIEDSIKSALDCVDEIIVGDTGSNDDTVYRVKNMGAKVINIDFNNDFSYARNQVIKEVKTDWILFLDADEKLNIDSVSLIKNLNPTKNIGGYNCKILNYYSYHSIYEYEGIYCRLFRNDDSIKYIYPIHEQILPSIIKRGYKILNSDIVIEHYGYSSPGLRRKKLERNLNIIENALKNGKDEYLLFHKGHVLYEMGYEEKARNVFETVNYKKLDSVTQSLFLYEYAYLLYKFGNIEKSLEMINSLLKIDKTNYRGRYLYALIMYENNRFNEAFDILISIEKDLLEGKRDLYGIYPDIGDIWFRIGVCALRSGRHQIGLEYIRKSANKGYKEAGELLRRMRMYA